MSVGRIGIRQTLSDAYAELCNVCKVWTSCKLFELCCALSEVLMKDDDKGLRGMTP